MTPERVRASAPLVLGERQRERYFEEPYLAKLPPRWDRVGYRSIFAAQAASAPAAYAE